jgi:hypothetical protein
MKTFLTCLSLVVFASITVPAETTPVVDRNEALAKADAFLGSTAFETELPCESKAQYFTPVQTVEYFACDDLGCGAGYTSLDTNESMAQVANCTTEGVSIYFENGKIWDLSKSEYEANHQNIARLFLSNLSQYIGYTGDVTITESAPTQYTLGNGSKIEAMNLIGQFHLPGAKYSFDLIVTIVKDAPGVAKIARLRIGTQTWIRLKEF